MLQVINITKEYRSGELTHIALSNININVKKGEYVSFLGPSGSGKSSLINILGMLDYPSQGNILFEGKSIVHMNDKKRLDFRKGKISYLFNDARLIDELTIAENIALPLLYTKKHRNERNNKVSEVLGKINLLHRKNYFPKDLSAFQKQKVSIARAIITNPVLILADEPTGNVNSTDGDEILRILSSINESGTTLLLFTHAPNIANRGQRVVELFDGHLVSENTMK